MKQFRWQRTHMGKSIGVEETRANKGFEEKRAENRKTQTNDKCAALAYDLHLM